MTFKVLSAHGSDREIWDAHVEMLPYDMRDVHFTSAYGRAQERPGETAHLAVYLSTDNVMLMKPFVWRVIGGSGYSDTACAGYGGIVTSAMMPATTDADLFDARWLDWCMSQNVVADFHLINPAYASQQYLLLPADAALVHERDVVFLFADKRRDELLSDMRPNRRYSYNSASPMTVRQVTGAQFSALYDAAMERKGASPRWRIDAAAIAKYAVELARQNSVALLGAFLPGEDEPQAVAMFTFGRMVAYYTLAATVAEPAQGLADHLIVEATEMARDRGCHWMHLGGGVSQADDDGVFMFKRSFGGMVRPMFSARRVINGEAYDKLSVAHGLHYKQGFFPAYRAAEALAS